MSSQGIEYIYLETHHLEESIAFWQQLGFQPVVNLGQACRLTHPNGGSVFLEAVSNAQSPAIELYLDARRSDQQSANAGDVAQEWQATHWGSHIQVLRDPDGRSIRLQDRGDR